MAFAPALLAPPAPEVADAAEVANVIDPTALGASQVLPPAPPPAASADLPLDALMAAGAAPPPAFPQTDVDAALAPALPPTGGPALSLLPPPEGAAVPGAAPAGTPAAAAHENLETSKAIGKEAVANAEEKAALDAEQAAEKAKFDAEKAKALQALQERQETHRQAAEALVTDARAKAESEPYHTFWETRTIGQNVATGIGLILGGVSWNANHVNRGVELLKNSMEQDFAIQKANHADLWRAVDEAQQGVRALDARELRETAQFSAVQGAKWDAVAGRLGAMVAANKGKGDVTTAKKVALEAAERATAFWTQSANAAATANHLQEQEKEANERAAIERERIAASERNAALRGKKRGTVGGGGTGVGFETAIRAMQEAADAGASLGEITIAGKALGRKEAEKQAKAIFDAKVKGGAAERSATKQELQISEKDAARTVRWHNGEKLGLAPAGKNVKDIGKDIASTKKYVGLINEVAESFEKYGHIIDSTSEEAKDRVSKMAELQALGRNISGLQASDAGQKLEHEMLGNNGVGPTHVFDILPSPKTLRNLGARADSFLLDKLRTTLDPIPGGMLDPNAGADESEVVLVRNKKTGKVEKFNAKTGQPVP